MVVEILEASEPAPVVMEEGAYACLVLSRIRNWSFFFYVRWYAFGVIWVLRDQSDLMFGGSLV